MNASRYKVVNSLNRLFLLDSLVKYSLQKQQVLLRIFVGPKNTLNVLKTNRCPSLSAEICSDFIFKIRLYGQIEFGFNNINFQNLCFVLARKFYVSSYQKI